MMNPPTAFKDKAEAAELKKQELKGAKLRL